MSRPRLIKDLKLRNSNLNHSELEHILEIFTETLSNAFRSRQVVEIRGFGRWQYKLLKENFNARNPSNNTLIYKPERVKVRFKPSKNLKKIINE